MIGFCGLNCSACSNNKGTVELDFDELAREAQKWSNEKNQYSVVDMICLGCTREKSCLMFPYCRTCSIRECALERPIRTCAECAEFLTCQKISKFLDSFSDNKLKQMMMLMHEKVIASHAEVAATTKS